MSETPRDVSPLQNSYIRDAELILHNEATNQANGDNGTVDGSEKILDMGTGNIRADLIVDIDTLDVADGDELYQLYFLVSNSSSFASGVEVGGILEVGADIAGYRSVDNTIGRYVLPVTNNVKGTQYRYGKLKVKVAGTSADIRYSAYLSKH